MHGHVLATGRLTGTYERPAGSAGWLPLVAGGGAVGLALVAIGRKQSRTAGDHA